MTTFAVSLKKEIARVARKELKGEIESLRRAAAGQRSEIAALKRELKSLRGDTKRNERRLKSVVSTVAAPEEQASERGRKVRYSAEGFAALRKKLGITQVQMARVLGVSGLSVSKWESGQVVPRQKQQEKVLALRKVGKRAVEKLLDAVE
jgi:DNA-binding transcriptional regulator YiaG